MRASVFWLTLLVAVTHARARLRETRDLDWTDTLGVRAAIVAGRVVGIIVFWGGAQDLIYFRF